MTEIALRCDGCGQAASAAHVARRLQRLEWATRYRPLHVGALLLGAVAPRDDAEFLYAPEGKFAGEAQRVLQATGVSASGKSPDAVLAEFQRCGFLLAHVLECPLEETNSGKVRELIEFCLPATLARIRRSLKPKRLALVSGAMAFAVARFQSANLSCALVLDDGKPFSLDADPPEDVVERLQQAITASSVVGR
jgi:hypothetical protein